VHPPDGCREGRHARTRKPPSLVGPASRVPPRACARSVILRCRSRAVNSRPLANGAVVIDLDDERGLAVLDVDDGARAAGMADRVGERLLTIRPRLRPQRPPTVPGACQPARAATDSRRSVNNPYPTALMFTLLAAHPTATAAVLLAAAHRGGRAIFWISGWIVLLALIVGAVVYFTRRGRRPPEPDDPTYRQPPERRHGS
jgi:hypothetical protein